MSNEENLNLEPYEEYNQALLELKDLREEINVSLGRKRTDLFLVNEMKKELMENGNGEVVKNIISDIEKDIALLEKILKIIRNILILF